MVRFFLLFLCFSHYSFGIDYYYGTDKGAETEMSDETLTRKLREKFRDGWSEFWFQYITVEVNQGIATLQGTVPSYSDKDTVESLVKSTDGVKKLISRLRVQPIAKQSTYPSDYAVTDLDSRLNRKIRDQAGRILNLKEVHLSTSYGDVLLEGKIENLTDQEKLVKEIRKIKGVNSVISHLTIKNLQERQTQN